ncbi:MAG: flagellar basal-body MS-ring/collar protein FliF [Chitinivibrionales bacterium]
MADFFKQLLSQLQAVWQRLSTQQKVITTSIIVFTILGLLTLVLWTRDGASDKGSRVLFSNMSVDEAAEVTETLTEAGYKYKLGNDGRTITVDNKQLYEIRMALARKGLPRSGGVGYEIFDKNNIGMTDFAQKVNARRALEGELQRTIEGLDEVKAARIHIANPEPTIFLDKKKDPKASVVVKTRLGRELTKNQIRGITHLVSSSVDGLKTENISVVDFEGKLLSNPYAGDETAFTGSRNMELQQTIERNMERKIERMLVGVLGPGKASVQVAADLDFDQVQRTMETYNPDSRVVRSEERIDDLTENAPDGERMMERSLTNYEIDKTVDHIVREVGNVKRLTIAVAVDGRYAREEQGEYKYQPRSTEEVMKIEDMVKNAVGYDLARGDQITVTNVKFDNEHLRRQQDQMRQEEIWERRLMIIKYVGIFLIAVLLIFFIRHLGKTLAEAMNPPAPVIEPLGMDDEVPVEVPDDVRRSNELLERVEMMTREEPVNIASIIRQWLQESASSQKRTKK